MTSHTSSFDSRFRQLIFLGACAVFAFTPLMYFHFQGLWAEEYYQYFPFIIAAVGWFMWDRWKTAEPCKESRLRNGLFWCLLVTGFLSLSFATFIWSPWVASFAFVVVMGAAALQVVRLHGRIPNQFGIWCLLWLLVPVPLQFDQRLVVRLQQISALLSGQVLDLLGIDHLMLGTVLELPDKQFFVDEACSGIVSVMSVIAAGAIYVVWRNRTLPHAVMLLVAGIGWAVVMNIGRITIIAIAHAWWDVDLSTGWQHDVLGLVLFSCTFIALVSTDQLLCFAGEPIEIKAADRDELRNPLVKWWNYAVTVLDPKRPVALSAVGIFDVADPHKSASTDLPVHTPSIRRDDPSLNHSAPEKGDSKTVSSKLVIVVSAIGVILGGLQLFVLSRGYRDPESPVELALSLDAGLLPDQVGDWEKVDFESVERETSNEFGNYSKQFTYRHVPTESTAVISLDFPYRGGWHELSVCYRNFGWPMVDRTVTDFPVDKGQGADENWKVVNADYEKPEGRYGFLAFSGTNGTAERLEPPSALVLWRPWFRLRRRLLHRMSPRFFQFQAWVESEQQISQATKKAVMELFLDLRPLVLQRLKAGPGAARHELEMTGEQAKAPPQSQSTEDPAGSVNN